MDSENLLSGVRELPSGGSFALVRKTLPGVLLAMGSRGSSYGPGGPVRKGGRGMASRSSRWKAIRGMAYERDRKANAPCWWCGQAINYIVPPSSTPDSWEGDHKIPVSKAPDLELDLNNVMPSHRHCNRSRGDGTNGENTLGMQSRVW